MVATGGVVDDFLSSLQRKAKIFGITLVQVPISWGNGNYIVDNPFFSSNQTPLFNANSTTSPFNAPFHIKYPQEFQAFLSVEGFIHTLLSNFDFLIEPPGYVHKSLAVFVTQVKDGFLFHLNLCTPSLGNVAIHTIREFSDFCSSEIQVKAFLTKNRFVLDQHKE